MHVRLPHILLIAATACSLGGGSGGAPYTIAAAGPWQLPRGRHTQLGIELALKEINSAGGVNGHRLEIKEADDRSDAELAAQIARRFADDRSVSAVIGHVTNDAMIAAARAYDGHVAAVTTAAGLPDLPGASGWVFRVLPGDSAEGVEMARYAMRTGHKRAAILYENDRRGRGIADAFRGTFMGEIIDVDPIRADAANHEVFISYFKLRQPDIVFVAGARGAALPMLAEARRQGLTADFMGGEGWAAVAEHPDVSDGVYIGMTFFAADPRPEAQRFVAAFRAANNGIQPDADAALGYDATKVVAAALAAVGPRRTKVRDWLAQLSVPVVGVTGPIRFRPSGDAAGVRVTMTRVRKDGTLLVEGTRK
ncbi:MAG: ABC transporter substrate-binding protein [Gemmatimonadales bacterium]